MSADILPQYVVFYDGHCRLCTDSVRTLRQMDATADLRYVDIRAGSELAKYPQINPAAALGQMHVIAPNGVVTGGFDAILALLPVFPSLRAFRPLLSVPLIREAGRRIYRWVARNRYRIAGATGCAGGACRIG
jgi:predicted DCC family thiol-disulfide oxidoreductase YuxK